MDRLAMNSIRSRILWTISPSGGSLLYVGFVCTNLDGRTAAAFDFVGGDGLEPIGFLPANGFLTVGEFPAQLLAAPGCTRGPIVMGSPYVRPGPVSVEDTSWGDVKALYR